MKKLFCGFLAIVLLLGVLVGCSSEKDDQFVTLSTGDKVFSFTAKEFQAAFNEQISVEAGKLDGWTPVDTELGSLFNKDFGGAVVYALTDEDTELVKAVGIRTNFLYQGGDSELWGRQISALVLAVDPTSDSETGKSILGELDMWDLVDWTPGHESQTVYNEIYYQAQLSKNYILDLVIFPMIGEEEEHAEEIPVLLPSQEADTSSQQADSNREENSQTESSSSQPIASSQSGSTGVTSPSESPETPTQPPASTPAQSSSVPAPEPTAPSGGVTAGQQNALAKAQSYLRYSAFSYEGLIGQLEYEGYSHDEATYGVQHCGADWNEQALKKAQSYLKYSAFSYQGLIDQLEYEQFTTAQATYGVDRCGADWNEQAAKKAASYLSYSAFSRDELIAQLEYEQFTHDQAVYGVEANGL